MSTFSTVDVVILDDIYKETLHILNEYDINNAIQSIGLIPEEFESRMKRVNIDFDVLEVYVAHPIDLIVSKLGRGDQRDVEDVMNSGILAQVEDYDQLRTIYNKSLEYAIGSRLRYPDIEQIIDQYQKRQKKG